ncbi:hypothetical protein K2173_023888 [Erythroxylum novogranatense]|uniref:KIB1-4 beta-propeller domain-containing protein n=1 Tax=Erythroxylum novogranatense TaxID=1862640 RepID=A0AAV8TRT8_9ROSI|nr:hypothetical protein K2173_023888 [Erythroxylum novogranatense]
MHRKEHKKSKKHVPLTATKTDDPSLWPHLPQQVIYLIAWDYTLLNHISFKGVTKSWIREHKKCSANSTEPLLRLYDGDDGSADKKPNNFAKHFKTGCNFRYYRGRPQHPWLSLVGCSQGLLLAHDVCYFLPEAPRRLWWRVPSWDSKYPFVCAVLSPSPVSTGSYLMLAVTGVTSPAFAFCKVGHGVEDGWIKQECTIADPHCSKSCITDRSMRFTNAIGFRGKFYALSLQGTLAVIEVIDSHPRITALSKKRAAPSVSSKHFRECFAESNGEILLAFLISRKSMNIVDGVEVYRLDIRNLTWIKVESLEDTTLLIRANCCMSVSASKVGCRRNCVYFRRRSADGWCVYDMEINTISSDWSESSSS